MSLSLPEDQTQIFFKKGSNCKKLGDEFRKDEQSARLARHGTDPCQAWNDWARHGRARRATEPCHSSPPCLTGGLGKALGLFFGPCQPKRHGSKTPRVNPEPSSQKTPVSIHISIYKTIEVSIQYNYSSLTFTIHRSNMKDKMIKF